MITTAARALAHARNLPPGPLLLASDFDGTISRPGRHPWRAAIIPSAQRALRRLAGTSGVSVALISGRAVDDLASRARIGGITYLGDHGAQRAEAPRGFRVSALAVEHESVEPAVAAMAERLKAEVPARIDEPWLVLEDKGPSLTFHFRMAPDTDAARVRVRAAVDLVDRVGVLDQPGGRRAWELRPPGATTKAVALERLVSDHDPGGVIMLGDDRHDASAFEALRRLRERDGPAALAIGVVSPAAEPEEIARSADLMLPSADEAARFLVLLARERTSSAA